jgi:hypothetical protein
MKYAVYLAEFLRLTPEGHDDHNSFYKISKELLPKIMETVEKKIKTEVVIPNDIV